MSVYLSAHCIKTNFREGKPIGKVQDLFNFKDVYVVGDESQNKGVVIIFTDVFGNRYNNNQLVADAFSKAGFHVLIPDLFDNDPVDETRFAEPGYFDQWKAKHGFNVTGIVSKQFLSAVKLNLKPSKIFGVGHCYGAKLVVQNLFKDGLLDAGANAHASGTDFEEIEQIVKPVIFSCAENDQAFDDETRNKTQSILKKNKINYQFDLFSGVSHGYAVRGDINDPDQAYAIDKTLQDQITWFNRFT